jgi:hypothetical protein
MAASRIPLADRFWSKVNKTETCWLWQAQFNNKGYGCFSYYSKKLGRKSVNMYAHRVAWTLTHGEITDGLEVLHRCDTPSCVNPGHLRLGTHADNMRDASTKGRICRTGRPLNRRKITRADILAIRADPRTTRVIAAAYGISHGYTAGIKRGEFPRDFTSSP